MSSYLPNWGFRNTVHAYHADKTVDLPLKGSAGAAATIPFSELVQKCVPALADGATHSLNPLLFNGALQTLYVPRADYSKEYPVFYAREITVVSEEEARKFENMPPGEFTVDFVVQPLEKSKQEFQKRYAETLPKGYPRLLPRTRYYTKEEMAVLYADWGQDNKPIVVIAPGLGGGVGEPQVRAVCQSLESRGSHVCVLNCRGCARSKITTPHLYSGLHTDDMRLTVSRLHELYPAKQIHMVGFSLGGLIMANYLAQEGDQSVVSSAVTVSSPWDLLDSLTHINASFTGKHLFQPAVTFFLNRMLRNNKEVLKQVPEVFDEDEFNRVKKTFKTTADFDDRYTCKLAGFPSVQTYYAAASPILRIFKIKTPFLMINSVDDPVISTSYPYHEVEKSPYLYMATCDLGGHYAWVGAKGKFWFSDLVGQFVDAFDKTVDQTQPVDDHGFHAVQTHFKDTIDLY